MGIIEILGLAGSLSLLSGWRLYLTVFATGVAMHFNLVPLPENLAMLDVLANPWVIGVSALGAVAEFFADKVAWQIQSGTGFTPSSAPSAALCWRSRWSTVPTRLGRLSRFCLAVVPLWQAMQQNRRHARRSTPVLSLSVMSWSRRSKMLRRAAC